VGQRSCRSAGPRSRCLMGPRPHQNLGLHVGG